MDPARKPKQTSHRRWLGIGCFGLAVVLFAVGLGYLKWADYLPPLDPDPRSLPDPNGYYACVLAASRLQPITAASPVSSAFTAAPAALRKALAPDEPALQALRQAMRLPYLHPPITLANLGGSSASEYASYREAVRCFAAESRVAAAEGRTGDAIERSLDAIDLGTRVGRGDALIGSLVGAACISIGMNAAERCVSRLSAGDAKRAGERLDRIIAEQPAASDVLDQERRVALLELRELASGRTSYANLPGAAPPGSPSPPWWSLAWQRTLVRLYPKSRSYRAINDYYRALESQLNRPMAQRTAPAEPTDWLARAYVLEPNVAFAALDRGRAEIVLLRGELALQEYRARTGSYPLSLTELKGIPGKSLVDPFSGQPLRYRRTPAQFLLYSVGPDGKDDGGRPISSWLFSPTVKGDLVAGKLFLKRPLPKVRR